MLGVLSLPISLIIRKIYELRRSLYRKGKLRSYKLDKPVISIGNLSLGGSGKTPFIIALVQYIESHNKKALILTRGYKSYYEQKCHLSKNGDDSDLMLLGDEALLMRSSFKSPILIGKNRHQNYRSMKNKCEFDFIILDDGFQHLKIKRDLDIVLLDATLKKENFKVFPSGYLREDKSALNDADFIILSKTNLAKTRDLDFYSQFNTDLKLSLKSSGYFDINDKKAEIKEKTRVLVISSIAKPEAFISGLQDDCLEIKEHLKLEDHEEISLEILNQVLRRCEQQDLTIICTEKDIVKLRKFTNHANIFYKKVYFDYNEFDNLFKEILNV